MKKWWSTFKINSEKKKNRKKGEEDLLSSKRNKWENTWQDKFKINIEKKLTKRRLMKNKLKYGKRIRMPSLKMKKISNNILKEFIRSMSKFYRHKCKISKTSKIEKKWIPYNFSTTKLLWKQLLNNHRMLKKQKFD